MGVLGFEDAISVEIIESKQVLGFFKLKSLNSLGCSKSEVRINGGLIPIYMLVKITLFTLEISLISQKIAN